MKLKQIALIILISCSVVTLGACSAKKHGYGYNDSSVGGADGAHAAGLGENDTFGSEEGSGQHASNKNTFYFDYDSNVIHDEDKSRIEAHANHLMSNPHKKVILEGHTDPRGSREYNVALGERRAYAVAELLRSKGVNPNQIRVVSYGAERLAAPGHSEDHYQLDRRAKIVYQ